MKGAPLFPVCGNPQCSTGWLHLWRNRQLPVFDGGWTCSEECTRHVIGVAVRHEMDGIESGPVEHRHRVPLGLLMLSQGWISQQQLKTALLLQKAAGHGRLGSWLVREAHISERLVTRALSMQWSCPVFSLDSLPDLSLGLMAPRLIAEAFGLLPLRIAGQKLLYVGFEDRVDRCLTFAIERITGLRVEAGLLDSAEFDSAHSLFLSQALFPRVTLVEAVNTEAMIAMLASYVERVRPLQARLVRVHDLYWMRMWSERFNPSSPSRREGTEDILCSIRHVADAHGSWA